MSTVQSLATAQTVEGTVVFSDIVGFTAFTAEAGDDEAARILAFQEDAVLGAIPEGARIVKELGDGVMLWFPDASSAVLTAVALQRRLAEQMRIGEFPVWTRMGVHSGKQTRRRDDLIGHDVNVAARIVDLAAPREILISESTRSQLPRDIEGLSFSEVGPVFVKGVPQPVWIHRVEATG